jgi:hypothetical protein
MSLDKDKASRSPPTLPKGSSKRLAYEFEITPYEKLNLDIAVVQLEVEYDLHEVTLLKPKLTTPTQLFQFSSAEKRRR